MLQAVCTTCDTASEGAKTGGGREMGEVQGLECQHACGHICEPVRGQDLHQVLHVLASTFWAVDCASSGVCLPEFIPPLYGSLSCKWEHLQLSSPMCWVAEGSVVDAVAGQHCFCC
jgi:hypothetical protein